MPTMAKVFKSGNSQAIQLPKEFMMDSEEVRISRNGEKIVLSLPKKERAKKPKEKNIARAYHILREMGDDGVVIDRGNDFPQTRELLKDGL